MHARPSYARHYFFFTSHLRTSVLERWGWLLILRTVLAPVQCVHASVQWRLRLCAMNSESGQAPVAKATRAFTAPTYGLKTAPTPPRTPKFKQGLKKLSAIHAFTGVGVTDTHYEREASRTSSRSGPLSVFRRAFAADYGWNHKIELAWQLHHATKNRTQMRFGAVLGAVLYGLFAVSDEVAPTWHSCLHFSQLFAVCTACECAYTLSHSQHASAYALRATQTLTRAHTDPLTKIHSRYTALR